jgi:hypothetical protein
MLEEPFNLGGVVQLGTRNGHRLAEQMNPGRAPE